MIRSNSDTPMVDLLVVDDTPGNLQPPDLILPDIKMPGMPANFGQEITLENRAATIQAVQTI